LAAGTYEYRARRGSESEALDHAALRQRLGIACAQASCDQTKRPAIARLFALSALEKSPDARQQSGWRCHRRHQRHHARFIFAQLHCQLGLPFTPHLIALNLALQLTPDVRADLLARETCRFTQQVTPER